MILWFMMGLTESEAPCKPDALNADAASRDVAPSVCWQGRLTWPLATTRKPSHSNA